MRRRDLLFVCVGFGGLLAGLVWALSTQFRWMQGNRPLQMQRPAAAAECVEPGPAASTGVIGDVNDDTRAAMAKQMESRRQRVAEPMARPAPKERAITNTKGGQGA